MLTIKNINNQLDAVLIKNGNMIYKNSKITLYCRKVKTNK
jgi:hypothetical protein